MSLSHFLLLIYPAGKLNPFPRHELLNFLVSFLMILDHFGTKLFHLGAFRFLKRQLSQRNFCLIPPAAVSRNKSSLSPVVAAGTDMKCGEGVTVAMKHMVRVIR